MDPGSACYTQPKVYEWRIVENKQNASFPVLLLSLMLGTKGLSLDCFGTNMCKDIGRAGTAVTSGKENISFEAALNEFKSAWPSDAKRMVHEVNKQLPHMNYHSVQFYYAPLRGRRCVNFWEYNDEWVRNPSFTVWVHTLRRKPKMLTDNVKRPIIEYQRGTRGGREDAVCAG